MLHWQVLNKEQSASYMWEVQGNLDTLSSMDVLFSVLYQCPQEQVPRTAEFAFAVKVQQVGLVFIV